MGKVVSVLCTSHSPALMLPFERWQTVYDYIESQRAAPPPEPLPRELARETPEIAAGRHAACLTAIAALRARLHAARPDLVVMFGDDQEENFQRGYMPPFAMFIGEETFGYPLKLLEVYFGEAPGPKRSVRGHAELARALVTQASERGFDLAYSEALPDQRWGLPHSISRIVHLLDIAAPVLPVFVNALYEPAAAPWRCYGLGATLKELIEANTPADYRVAVIGSGGLSHTPRGERAGYVNAEHDRWVVEQLRDGCGSALGQLTTDELWAGANHELREWLPAVAMVGDRPAYYLDYVLSYRLIAGYGFAAWSLD
jgi:hypothetical protein